jgi:ParB family transcriptional regulator, chromosome partitioning protein
MSKASRCRQSDKNPRFPTLEKINKVHSNQKDTKIMTNDTNRTMIGLSRLVPSPDNARRTNSTAGIAELSASIDSLGLLQNLTVRAAKKGKKFEVVAGARRLSALRQLASEGKIAADYPVAVNIIAAHSVEISLAENFQRQHMHPADECSAFREVHEREGLSADEIAARFGISAVTVRRRLKLANLSPRILEAFRQDEVTTEQAIALALTDDHMAQERAIFEVEEWQRQPRHIRHLLTDDKLRADDPIARFIDPDAYRAAGGTFTQDLFADDGNILWDNRALAVKLAMDMLEKEAVAIQDAEGWAWVEPSTDLSELYQYSRIHPARRPYTPEESAELQSLNDEMEDITRHIDDLAEGDAQLETLESRARAIENRMADIEDTITSYSSENKQYAGCFVGIARDGSWRIERGIVKPEDRAKLHRPAVAGTSTTPVKVEPEGQGVVLSAPVIEELTAIRSAALRVEVAQRPTIALAALLHPLVNQCFYGYRIWGIEPAAEMRGEMKALEPLLTNPDDCPAFVAWRATVSLWQERLPAEPSGVWDWLLDQTADMLLELLAVVTAANINAVVMRHEKRSSRIDAADQIAEAVNLDMTASWSADRAFLKRNSKAQIAQIMREAGCSEKEIAQAAQHSKGAMVNIAADALKSRNWLPAALQSAPVITENDSPDTEKSESVEEYSRAA